MLARVREREREKGRGIQKEIERGSEERERGTEWGIEHVRACGGQMQSENSVDWRNQKGRDRDRDTLTERMR